MYRESVVFYHMRKLPYLGKLGQVLKEMGAELLERGPEDAGQKIGFLVGLPGFEKAQGVLPMKIPEEIMILNGFTSSRMDELFKRMREAGIPKIALKAAITESNKNWTLGQLYIEIRMEHEEIKRRMQ
ncbi:MAG: DUF3783 domain-containing protein [Eubacteriales bacterium]|nr:DUF3783 domain-containing protein [Eubacteriales bacterium]